MNGCDPSLKANGGTALRCRITQGREDAFEDWVVGIRMDSRQQVDWHFDQGYGTGLESNIAAVKYAGSSRQVAKAVELRPLPQGCQIVENNVKLLAELPGEIFHALSKDDTPTGWWTEPF